MGEARLVVDPDHTLGDVEDALDLRAARDLESLAVWSVENGSACRSTASAFTMSVTSPWLPPSLDE
jgi:hypothetical protein